VSPLLSARRPRTVATVTRAEDLDVLTLDRDPDTDILEYRIDNLLPVLDEAERSCIETTPPALVTVRAPAEGGAHALGSGQRRELYERFLPVAALVDTEIASLESREFRNFASTTRAHDVPLVASFHDFAGYPGLPALEERIERARSLGADLPKLAVVVSTMKQLGELAVLVEREASEGRLVSAMGMGPLGKVSRLVLARAGSCLNYGFLREPNAPGQWPAADLRRLIAAL